MSSVQLRMLITTRSETNKSGYLKLSGYGSKMTEIRMLYIPHLGERLQITSPKTQFIL